MDNSFIHRKRVLIVDDEPELLELVSGILTDAGFTEVFTAGSAAEAVARFRETAPELIILDVMLPDGDGFSLMRQMRSSSEVPVVFLTAKDEPIDRISGLGLGADDYIVKPFLPQELLLRLYAVARRTYRSESDQIALDGCTVDFSKGEVRRDGETIALTAKEFALLEVLARNRGKIVTVDAICEAMWGGDPFGYEGPLNAHVRRVREKIERDPSHPTSLVTMKGLGYKLRVIE
ncbi:response regulator transcription factor [Adlercreutzia sp. R21]|uniref:response regulator transcription factor n=1 Tax=Adlercreutzia wanghongyangiae TaxID=3111451 RepID=UPI002DBD6C83|nr:response regulator transcription factor [Adlercreutzia sp. R21]MEC4184459.1 response regulator transcription factor [Adlercreutzia sp. R21]